jgi:hypothetical protein
MLDVSVSPDRSGRNVELRYRLAHGLRSLSSCSGLTSRDRVGVGPSAPFRAEPFGSKTRRWGHVASGGVYLARVVRGSIGPRVPTGSQEMHFLVPGLRRPYQRKTPPERGFSIAGAGFEPATFGL